MNKVNRPLAGRCIGISISESDNLAALGFGANVVNALTVDLARRLIGLGATVALGHNWQSGGIMEALAGFALSYKSQSAGTKAPLILNYLAHPDQPSLSELDRQELEPIVAMETIRWDQHEGEIFDYLAQPALSNYESAARMRGQRPLSDAPQDTRPFDLTAMRFVLTKRCDTRLLIGGRTTGYQGRAPGILEEAWWTLAMGKQLVVCTAMDGAARAIVEPGSKAGAEILDDGKHELARTYLRDFHALAPRMSFPIVSFLSVDALLMQLATSLG